MGGPASDSEWRTVVGVVSPMHYRELAVARATLYLPAPQFIDSAQTLLLRTALPPAALAGLVRERVKAVDPTARVMAVVPFAQFLEGPLARPRFNAFLIGVFGIASLLLATIGLYAVMAAYVRQRRADIGIRVTLGATPAGVCRLVLGEGLRLASTGALIGVAMAVGITRLLRGLLFAVHPLDPATMLGAVALLVGASALACYVPAWRATRVDPVIALRMT
jgi:ABC-type antimicrobial peptide transport system permease subunit